MLGVKPLLASLLVEQDDCTATEVDDFLIIVLKLLLIFVAGPYRVGKLSADSVLHAPLCVLAADAIHPLQLDFDLVRCLQVVVHCDALEPVGYYWLQSCVKPSPEIPGPLVSNQLRG